MTALASQYEALNLAQGLMWLQTSPVLLEEGIRAMSDPSLHQYTHPAGFYPLRETLAHLSERFFGVSYDPVSEISITVGATQALFSVVQALTKPGDEAIFIEPAYDSYLPALQIGTLKAYAVSLDIRPSGVFLHWEKVERYLSPRTRLLLLNFPHNPTGRVLRPSDVKVLEEIAQRFPELVIVVDEAYEYMYWHPDPEREEALPPRSLRQSPLLREKTVIVGSLGKVVGATGWRLGYVAAPAPLTTRIRAVHQFITFCASTPLQVAVARYLSADPHRVFYFHAALLERRKAFVSLLRSHTSLEVLPPEGGYFVLVRSNNQDLPDRLLAEHLTRTAKVAAIPLSPFYKDGTDSGWLRLCFARPMDMLREAAQRLGQVYPAGLSIAHLNE
ncbi:MAG: aminotransferase class I/II-fold pyridoxal phosphate-dependent enzyme [Bacteroidia bacterium]|nr:aminotransferase class I/II-fold pyridoxal phosphate-dependent enzyme [Bacteroidia bacterium]